MTIRYILKSKLDSFDQFTMVIMISEIIIDNLLQFFHCFWGSTSDICFDNRPEIKIKYWIWVRDQEPTRTLFSGHSDVGDIVMLVTLWWWLISDLGGRIIMLATFFVKLRKLTLCVKSVTNIVIRSPTSQTCNQQIWSPTSVTNIDVTFGPGSWIG